MNDTLNLTEHAQERVTELISDVRYYIAEGLPLDVALTHVHKGTCISQELWAKVYAAVTTYNDQTSANECPCEECQKHAPLYPWIVYPVKRTQENGMGTPKSLRVFFPSGERGYTKLTRYLIDYGYSPVTSLRVMTHEQVKQLYSGNGVTI